MFFLLFNVAIRKFYITHVVHIVLLLDRNKQWTALRFLTRWGCIYVMCRWGHRKMLWMYTDLKQQMINKLKNIRTTNDGRSKCQIKTKFIHLIIPAFICARISITSWDSRPKWEKRFVLQKPTDQRGRKEGIWKLNILNVLKIQNYAVIW